MLTGKPYLDELKNQVIRDYLKENGRGPTPREIQDLLDQAKQNYPSIDTLGFSGYETYKPKFRDVSSADKENKTRDAFYTDLKVIHSKLDNLTQRLEDSFRGFQNTSKRVSRNLTNLENRIDNLLLVNSNVDVFIQGIEETFDTHENIDLDNTTASVNNGYVTLGKTSLSEVNLSDVLIRASATSEKGFIGVQNSSSIEHLKENDGSFWEQLVYTRYNQGRVSCLIELEMPEPLYINDLNFTTSNIAVNKKLTCSIFYSIDGQTFTAYEPAEVVVNSNEMSFNLGIDNVKKVQILLSKNAADNTVVGSSQHVYIFSLDSIKILSDKYTSSKESVLIAGPYDFSDAEGNPLYFTKATLEACVISGTNTSVDFYLSKDKLNWKSVSWNRETNNVVSFADSSSTKSVNYFDLTMSANGLLIDATEFADYAFAEESILNKGISADYADKINYDTIVVKRNTVEDDGTFAGLSRGWKFDPVDKTYNTTVYIDNSEGRIIDFGPTGIFVNDQLKSGEVLLQPGYSVLKTDDANWIEIEGVANSLKELRQKDPLYPYNHKYLIEGFNYPATFLGEQMYNGVDEYFARLLEYTPPEYFNALESSDPDYYNYFTVENVTGDYYIKIKVDKTNIDWMNETFSADWNVQLKDNNQIFVKAILKTSNSENTPKIEDYMIRVI